MRTKNCRISANFRDESYCDRCGSFGHTRVIYVEDSVQEYCIRVCTKWDACSYREAVRT